MRDDWNSFLQKIYLALCLGMLVSCSTTRLAPPEPAVEAVLPSAGKRLTDLKRVALMENQVAASIRTLDAAIEEALIDRQRLGYYSNRQHAALERAYYQFRGISEPLKAVHRDYAPWESPARFGRDAASLDEMEAAIVGLYADRLALVSATLAVKSMQRDPSLITKFNEAFLISEKPRGTFDLLFNGVTSGDAWRQRLKRSRAVTRIEGEVLSPPFNAGKQRAADMHAMIGPLRRDVIKRGYSVFPELSNELHHTLLASWIRDNRTGLTNRLRSARDVLFAEVAAIPYPGEELSEFTSGQKRRLHRLLQPGDILLTYTGGYMSNLFLPGAFKHAITYVGDNAQRRRAGLKPSRIDYIDGIEFTRLRERLEIEQIDGVSGEVPADVIEAVAEGVIFNSLDHLLDTHVTRVVALRPRISDDDRRSFLLRVFSLLGTKYDFAFDFSDASSHCCTEVVYRTLNQTGAIDFSLSKRGGYYNMSGDDIVNAYYRQPDAFELVFLAVPDSENGDRKAKILREWDAERKLRALVPPQLTGGNE